MKFNKFSKHIKESTVTPEDIAALNEAKFNLKSSRKVADLLAKIASKKLSSKFSYAWTDEFKKNSGAQGSGLRYLSQDGLQLRFNHVKSNGSFAINSVDFWRAGDTLTEPTISIYFKEDVNIVKIKDQLFNSIKAGRIVPIALDVFTEAINESPSDERLEYLLAKGLPASYSKEKAKFLRLLDKEGLSAEWAEWGSMKKNDSEKTDFDQTLRVSAARLTDKNFYADPKYVFDDIKHGAELIAKGLWRSMIVAGMGGIGKTFGIKATLTSMLGQYQEGPGGKWAYYEGMKGLGMGYYITFLLNKDKIVVVDDSDSIWYKGNINMMKIITSDSGDRAPSWAGSGTANVSMMSTEEREIYELQYFDKVLDDPNTTFKPPSKFNFTGQFINISNLKGQDFDAAIKSRSVFIDVYLAQRDVIRRMATIMEFEGSDQKEILEVLEALDPKAKDALNGTGKYAEQPQYMTPEEARKNKQLNMRSVGIAKAMRRSGWPGWQRAAGLYS